jgi:antirestriction protein ArdC
MANDKANGAMAETVNALIAMIEAGADGSGWRKCWKTMAAPRTAMNAATGKRYTGGNAVRLGLFEMLGAVGPWGTYNQWQGLGAQVRKGERGTYVLVPKPFVKKTEDPRTGEEVTARGMVFGVASVFHAGQVDGYVPKVTGDAPAVDGAAEDDGTEVVPIDAAQAWSDAVIAAGPVVMALGSPSYASVRDLVRMPAFSDFETAEGYYATLWHELTHWTAPRVSRECSFKRWGDAQYAAEELVAELGAAFLCRDLGIVDDAAAPRQDHAQYLASWLGALKADPSRLWTAASAAEKAVGYLHSLAAGDAAETDAQGPETADAEGARETARETAREMVDA